MVRGRVGGVRVAWRVRFSHSWRAVNGFVECGVGLGASVTVEGVFNDPGFPSEAGGAGGPVHAVAPGAVVASQFTHDAPSVGN
jgi:hypothetical protein